MQRILNLDQSRLIKRPEWGTVRFEEIQSNIERTYRLAQQLINLPLERLLEKTIDNINALTRQVAVSFEQLDRFSLGISGNSDKSYHVRSIQQSTNPFFETSAPWVPYLAYQRGDIDQNIEKITRSAKEVEKIVTATNKGASEMEEIIDKAREASAKEGAAVFTEDFEKVANEMEKSAKIWLRGTIGAAFVTVVVALGMWFWTESGLDQGQIFQKIGTKMVVLAVLLTGTIWCGRNYRALKHLATINNHRAISIRTLQAFSSAAAQTQTKDAVLMEATRAVFGNVPTGFIGQTSSDSDLKVIEVARNILPESDSK